MRKELLIILYMFSTVVFAQERQILCEDSSCSTNFNPEKQTEKTLFTSIIVGSRNERDINVSVPDSAKPRSVRLYVEQNSTTFSNNLNINLSSLNSQYNAANTMVIGDVFNNVVVRSNGYSGVSGKSASQLCAETFRSGEAGFGETARSEFEFRRILDLSLPVNNCSYVDLKYLQDNFTCGDANLKEIIDVNNPEVEVERVRGKYRCIGMSYHDVCISPTIQIECKFKIKYTDPPSVAGQFSTSANDEEVKYLTMPESEYYSNLAKDPGFKDYICENLSRLENEPAPVELVSNNEFYKDLNAWINDGASWDSTKERMKLNGGLDVERKAVAYQAISTEPNKKYRLKATWARDESVSNISTGIINIYSDAGRNNKLQTQEIYSTGSIKGVFLTSDQTPHHFGYVRSEVETTPSVVFTIQNKDDRAARSCGAVYLVGDATDFNITNDSCTQATMAPGDSCSVSIQATPQSIGQKAARIKRDCRDDFGNTTTQLDDEIYVSSYKDYIQTVASNLSTAYVDGYFWKLKNPTSANPIWLRCSADIPNSKNCLNSAQEITTNRCTTKGVYCPGYSPLNMTIPYPIPSATQRIYPLVLHSSIPSNNRIENKEVDFIFTATSTTTVIELSTLSKFHPGTFDSLSLVKLSDNAGPTTKPPANKICPNVGCVAGALGNGYYSLFSTSTKRTSPAYDDTYYTIPEGSDWRMRYVPVGSSCPVGFTKLKSNHLASNIAYDNNDNLCDDVFVPEDPTGKVISWLYVGFDRLPEFGTEKISCKMGDCIVQTSIREMEKNLITYNPGSGSDGTQQGEGILFVYDARTVLTEAKNGKGGAIGDNDLPTLQEPRICARIQDAKEDINSNFAKSPVVDFYKINWKAIKVIENGNFGLNPPNNGKTIKVFKKMDSSIRYLLKEELL